MGWARTLLLGDIGNRLDIADAEKDIDGIYRDLSKSRVRDESQDQAIERLKQENEQLELCLAALIKTLEGRNILSAEEVERLANLTDREG